MSKNLIDYIIEGIQNKKGKEIVNISLSKLDNSICDNFIICHGDSNVHVSAIANSIEKHVKENLNEYVVHREGLNNSQWVILDYHNIVIHVFQKDVRYYYNLEELWHDAYIEQYDN
jgi:ribosome-associated protein